MEELIESLFKRLNYEIHMKKDENGKMQVISGNKMSILYALNEIIILLIKNGISEEDIRAVIEIALADDEEKLKDPKKVADKILQKMGRR